MKPKWPLQVGEYSQQHKFLYILYVELQPYFTRITWHSCPTTHQRFRPVPTMNFFGIMLRNRCRPTKAWACYEFQAPLKLDRCEISPLASLTFGGLIRWSFSSVIEHVGLVRQTSLWTLKTFASSSLQFNHNDNLCDFAHVVHFLFFLHIQFDIISFLLMIRLHFVNPCASSTNVAQKNRVNEQS